MPVTRSSTVRTWGCPAASSDCCTTVTSSPTPTLSFRAPVMVGATVETTIEVIELIERGRRVKLKCECRVGDKVVLEGEAEVKAMAKPV